MINPMTQSKQTLKNSKDSIAHLCQQPDVRKQPNTRSTVQRVLVDSLPSNEMSVLVERQQDVRLSSVAIKEPNQGYVLGGSF